MSALYYGLLLYLRLKSLSGSMRINYINLRTESLVKFIEVSKIRDPRNPKIVIATSLIMEFILSVFATPYYISSLNIPRPKLTIMGLSSP